MAKIYIQYQKQTENKRNGAIDKFKWSKRNVFSDRQYLSIGKVFEKCEKTWKNKLLKMRKIIDLFGADIQINFAESI